MSAEYREGVPGPEFSRQTAGVQSLCEKQAALRQIVPSCDFQILSPAMSQPWSYTYLLRFLSQAASSGHEMEEDVVRFAQRRQRREAA